MLLLLPITWLSNCFVFLETDPEASHKADPAEAQSEPQGIDTHKHTL